MHGVKVGALVVYLVAPGDGWLLDMHLSRLARTRLPGGTFKVYAAALRLPPQHRDALESRDFVDIVDVEPTDLRLSAEHGTLLDRLAAYALADGCDYVCSFDVDSWPIRDNWIEVAQSRIAAAGAVGAAVLRAENRDTVLPHPSFCMLKAEAFTDPGCRFWWPPEEMDAEFRNFLESHGQRSIDTGIGIGYSLHRRRLPWVPLRRSNRRDLHYLMAGIYGDLVFHLVASGRPRIFNAEGGTWANRLTRPLGSVPGLWRLRPRLERALEQVYEPPIYRRNRRICDLIIDRLRSDEDGFYRYLLAGEAAQLPGDGAQAEA